MSDKEGGGGWSFGTVLRSALKAVLLLILEAMVAVVLFNLKTIVKSVFSGPAAAAGGGPNDTALGQHVNWRDMDGGTKPIITVGFF